MASDPDGRGPYATALRVNSSAAAPLEKLVREFGYGSPACEIINYWTGDDRLPEQPLITCTNPHFSSTRIEAALPATVRA